LILNELSFFLSYLKLPNSRGHDYGWHLQRQSGQEIENLQKRFNNQHKKRLSTVVLGYD
jgi:hypothetical protein